MNSWLEELAVSFIPTTTKSPSIRKHKENFLRHVKHHGYGRTNQFAVTEKLVGLEEKLQVLNLDDVAGELFSRRVELDRDHEDVKWLPDVLDLLLYLSNDPVRNSRVEKLENIKPTNDIPKELKWEDIEADDPIDMEDPIWQVPHYSDFSSDEDEGFVASSTQTSPASIKLQRATKLDPENIFDLATTAEASTLDATQFWKRQGQGVTITETQAIREVLFLLGGLPTSVFTSSSHVVKPNPRFRIRHLQATTSLLLLEEAANLASEVDAVRQWLRIPQSQSVMQLIRSEIQEILADFEKAISQEHTAILTQTSPNGVVSLLQVLQRAKQASLPLQAVRTLVPQLATSDVVIVLDTFHHRLDFAQSSCNSVEVEAFLPIFLSALTLYLKPVDAWIHTGTLESTDSFFIIANENKPRNKSTLWHDWFDVSPRQEELIPGFLKNSTAKIFTIGKTAAFLQHLGSVPADNQVEDLGVAAAALEAANLVAGSPLPFSATFEMVLEQHLNAMLSASTAHLKHVLDTSCGLTRLLDAVEHLYLAKDGVILGMIESKMFEQIDRCMDMWNDRFLLNDTLADAYASINCVDAEAITISSTYTSSRTLENRRRSVKILGSVSTLYQISWPLANMILPASISSYQRIALSLSQIRRARSLLERRAHFYVQHMPLFDDQSDTKLARAVYWQLAIFVNVLYAHLTSCVIQPLTTAMREQLQSFSTSSLDDMISIHKQYITALEHACLSSKRIKPLRDAVISVLDLCIRFTDLVTSTIANGPRSSSRNANGDFEASSFVSAQSRRRRHRRAQNSIGISSDDDDTDEANGIEGYSTFILDEDTSLIQEVRKVKSEFERHVEFLIAGSRAVARSSASGSGVQAGHFEVGERFELLAEALEGVFPLKGKIGAF
ncbi:hypothetical protein H2200_001014 [Cladophialophora chaetospira]|uniref:Spindle pole body component n=1 Tax=Cladophialophora chaetospira TaxID=386627 RepID=A0AA38XPG7_9EURO|nr:hypothetical protein H2200_001014 [Cladophialophora chaetospira]